MVEITAELKAGEERADRRGDSAGQLIAGQVSETDTGIRSRTRTCKERSTKTA